MQNKIIKLSLSSHAQNGPNCVHLYNRSSMKIDSRDYSSEKYMYYKRKLCSYCHQTFIEKKISSNKSKFAHLIIKRTLQKGIRSNNSTYAEPMPCRASRSKPGRTGSSPDGSGGRCRKGIQSLCRSGPPRPLPSGRARPTQCRSGTCSSPGGCLKKPRKNRSYNIAVSKWYQKPEARMFSKRTSN